MQNRRAVLQSEATAQGRVASLLFSQRCLSRRACCLAFCLLFLPLPCYAQGVSSRELINNAKAYDGRLVTYEGEVVGEVMARGQYSWVNISDGDNAIGVWMPKALSDQIEYATSYKFKGDRVVVKGFFQRACSQHGGDLDIHAISLQKIAPGRQIHHRLGEDKKTLAMVLGVMVVLIWILTLFIKK